MTYILWEESGTLLANNLPCNILCKEASPIEMVPPTSKSRGLGTLCPVSEVRPLINLSPLLLLVLEDAREGDPHVAELVFVLHNCHYNFFKE